MKLPNAQAAEIPQSKVEGYLLSSSHPTGRSKAALAFARSMAPVSRFSTGMREGDEMNLVVAVAVDHEVWEAAKRQAAYSVLGLALAVRLRPIRVDVGPASGRARPQQGIRRQDRAGGLRTSPLQLGTRPPPPIQLAVASLREELRFNLSADVFPVRGNRLPSIQHGASALDLGRPCLVHADLGPCRGSRSSAPRSPLAHLPAVQEHPEESCGQQTTWRDGSTDGWGIEVG